MKGHPREWAAFARSVTAVVAAALEDQTAVRPRQPLEVSFQLLAALEDMEPRFPADGITDGGNTVQLTVREEPDELWVEIQALGYGTLLAAAGKWAELTSVDGLVQGRFRFDAAGSGLCILRDTSAVRRALLAPILRIDV
jgi:hypothetical protein